MTIPDPKDDAMAARRCAVAHPNDGSPGYTARRGLDVPRGSRVSQLGLAVASAGVWAAMPGRAASSLIRAPGPS
ncbi:hypothetical protein HMPREF9567_00515 [Cutibacterium acnes HL013PA1]|nr:hypothetical protein HMPREF9567_00515 [Cutibacterium acnes HL013PA1]